MESAVIERVKQVIDLKGLSVRAFANKIGFNYSTLNNYMTGRRSNVDLDLIVKIESTFDDISPAWLLTGKGNMYKTIEAIEVSNSENLGEFFVENSNGAKFYDLGNGKYRMNVPLVPYCAYGRFANEDTVLLQDLDDWDNEDFEVSQIAHGNYLSFEVKGDSMDDGTRYSFEEGERVLARELNRVHWKDGLRYNKYPFWVIVFDSSVLIKQITDQDMETGEITCHSLNPSPQYADFKLSLNDVRRLYNVVQKKTKAINY